jgi:hypothetical protein
VARQFKCDFLRQSIACPGRRPCLWAATSALALVVACTPTVYKPEVEKFSTDVGVASSSFDELVDTNIEQDFKDRNTELVAANNRLVLSDSCIRMEQHISTQNECLASWSLHRQNPSTPEPACAEPEPFAPLIPDELRDCELGSLQNGGFQASPIASATDSANHKRLADALAAYASQLGAMVSSTDAEQLDAATVDAGAALKSLQSKIVAADPTSEPPLDIGPIVGLVGAGLRAGLEARRFQQLKRITEKADPIVQQASGRLSIYATQLYAINVVEPSLKEADAAALRAVPNPPETFPARVDAAALRKREYDAVVAVEPSQVFGAVANAHHELVLALNDPSRQYEALRAAVANLTEKVNALAAALKKPEETPAG